MSIFSRLFSTQRQPPSPEDRRKALESLPPALKGQTPLTVIPVSAVERATTPLPEVSYLVGVETRLKPLPFIERPYGPKQPKTIVAPTHPLEACRRYHGRLVEGVCQHPFMAALHMAFDQHRPLMLSPDMFWLLITQSLAQHVNANAERLRKEFVAQDGKATLTVRRDDFVRGSRENPWEEVFQEFSEQIKTHIGAVSHARLMPEFSTTGPAERAAAQIVLLDLLQSYFKFEVYSLCGIPEVQLEGSVEDWERLVQKTLELPCSDLKEWIGILVPILEQIAQSVRGQANQEFWKNIYKAGGGSGGPYITGWINAFFLYLIKDRATQTMMFNPWLKKDPESLRLYLNPQEPGKRDFGFGATSEYYPSGLARAPFVWNYLKTEIEMEFLGGFTGVMQHPDTLVLRPEIGWAVREA